MNTTDTTPLKYKLVNIYTGKTVKRGTLTKAEAIHLSYAYAMNGSPLRWKLA